MTGEYHICHTQPFVHFEHRIYRIKPVCLCRSWNNWEPCATFLAFAIGVDPGCLDAQEEAQSFQLRPDR